MTGIIRGLGGGRGRKCESFRQHRPQKGGCCQKTPHFSTPKHAVPNSNSEQSRTMRLRNMYPSRVDNEMEGHAKILVPGGGEGRAVHLTDRSRPASCVVSCQDSGWPARSHLRPSLPFANDTNLHNSTCKLQPERRVHQSCAGGAILLHCCHWSRSRQSPPPGEPDVTQPSPQPSVSSWLV